MRSRYICILKHVSDPFLEREMSTFVCWHTRNERLPGISDKIIQFIRKTERQDYYIIFDLRFHILKIYLLFGTICLKLFITYVWRYESISVPKCLAQIYANKSCKRVSTLHKLSTGQLILHNGECKCSELS